MPAHHTVTTRETTEAEQRANARERVASDARRGIVPSDAYSADDLAWSFAGHEHELQELEELAAQAPAAEAEQLTRRERRAQLQAMVAQVLAEHDAERRRQAEAEARKRLGWKRDEQP